MKFTSVLLILYQLFKETNSLSDIHHERNFFLPQLFSFRKLSPWILNLSLWWFAMALPPPSETFNPWNFRFGFGATFPDASEIVDANTPNGINISAGIGYQYFSHLQLLGTLHFDYFTDDKRTDYKTYIIVFGVNFETKLHLLPIAKKISPYAVGGLAPALYVNTKPYVESGEDFDPYTTSRNYELKPGYTLKYGLGSNFIIGGDLRIYLEWVYTRLGFFSSKKPLYYRALMVGLLLDVDWILGKSGP